LKDVYYFSYADVRTQKQKELGIIEEGETARLSIDTGQATAAKLSKCMSIGSVTSGSQSDCNGNIYILYFSLVLLLLFFWGGG